MRRLALLLVVLFLSSAAYAIDGEIAGKIGSINKLTGEIVVNTGNSKYQIDMGDKLYVRIEGNPVIIKAVFPMLTIVKCRLDSKYKKNLKDIEEGMQVYKYKPGIESTDESSIEPGIDSLNRRRGLETDKSLPSQYHDTIWKIKAPGGDPELYYVIFKPDGKLGYSYQSIETLQVDNTDSWHVEGDALVIVWTNGYSTEKFKIVPGGGVFKGKKTSKNYADAKDCTIEKIK